MNIQKVLDAISEQRNQALNEVAVLKAEIFDLQASLANASGELAQMRTAITPEWFHQCAIDGAKLMKSGETCEACGRSEKE